MKKGKLFTILGSFCLMLVISALPFMAACATEEPTPTTPATTPTTPTPAPTATPEKVIEIKVANYYAPTHRLSPDAFEQWGKEIVKRTDGKVEFTWYHGQSLMTSQETPQALKAGICDVGIWCTPFNAGLFPVTEVIDLPLIVRLSAEGSPAMWEFYTQSPEMQKEWAGYKPAWFHVTAISNFHTKKVFIRTLEDLDGLRMVTGSATKGEMLRLLGAVHVNLTAGDIYPALERDMVDGLFYPWAPQRSWKLTEFIKYHTLADVSVTPHAGAFNLEVWDTLPADVQQVISDLSMSMSGLCGATLTNESAWVIDEMKAKGDEFYTLPSDEKARWVDQISPVYDRWLDMVASKGVDGQAVLDSWKQCAAEYRETPYQPDDWWGRAGKKE